MESCIIAIVLSIWAYDCVSDYCRYTIMINDIMWIYRNIFV